ncbi:MAG: hypothetical protein KIH80_007365 [Flavobacteriia bacterium]|nr:hypothetical protein [Flavobacteriia bacterium]
MRKLLFLAVVLLLSACTWFTPKEVLRDQYVHAELQAIDWQSVDQFPLFNSCDETATKQSQQQCFERVLNEQLREIISRMSMEEKLEISGSFSLSIQVNDQGDILLLDLINGAFSEETTTYLMTEFSKEFSQIKQLSPALKQGMPVATQYQIPIEIHLD